MENKWKKIRIEWKKCWTLSYLNNLQFFPEAVEDFLQAWTLILQVSGFTPLWIVVTQNNPASLFQKCYIMAGLAFSETEKWTLAWDRKKLNEVSYLQMQWSIEM